MTTVVDAELLLNCRCGHGLGEHNGLGCYARISYEPLATCTCELTDDRTHADVLAENLPRALAAAQSEALQKVAVTLSQRRLGMAFPDPWREGWNRALEVAQDDIRGVLTASEGGDGP